MMHSKKKRRIEVALHGLTDGINLIADNNTLRIAKLIPGQRPIVLLDLNEGQVQRNAIGQQLTPVTLRQVLFLIPGDAVRF